MAKVFLLEHTIPRSDHDNVKFIGVYSTKQSAEAAISRLKNLPGFRDPTGEFVLEAYELDKDHWAEGFGE